MVAKAQILETLRRAFVSRVTLLNQGAAIHGSQALMLTPISDPLLPKLPAGDLRVGDVVKELVTA